MSGYSASNEITWKEIFGIYPEKNICIMQDMWRYLISIYHMTSKIFRLNQLGFASHL